MSGSGYWAEPLDTTTASGSGSGTPEGTQTAVASIESIGAQSELVPESSIVIVQDCQPWGANGNQEALDALGESYHTVPSSSLGDLDLSDVSLLVVPSGQPVEYYDRFVEHRGKIETFVSNGGTLIARLGSHAAGECTSFYDEPFVPGGIRGHLEPYHEPLHIEQSDHPIFDGLSDEDVSPISDTAGGHIENLPDDTELLLTVGGYDSFPAYVEYEFGSGRVLASIVAYELPYAYPEISEFENLLERVFAYALDLEGPSGREVSASVTTLQFIPGKEENESRGGYPLDSGLIQVFGEGSTIPTRYVLGRDLPLKPVLDSWLTGDMTDTLPAYLRADDHPEVGRGALESVQGKYFDDIGPTESFREFRFHNGVSISFDVTSEGKVVQDSVKIEFLEDGLKPEDPKISLGRLENSYTVLHDHEVDGIPWREWYVDNQERSNRHTRYYKYDTDYEFDGIEGVRVTTIAGGWAGFVQDFSRRVGDDAPAFINEVMDWGIPDWQAWLAMLFMPPGSQFLIDYLAVVPNTYTFLDFIVLADGRRYVRVWDASAYPSLATYVDGERRALERMPYEPRELLFNFAMDKFFAQASAGVTPYTGPLWMYVLMIEYPDLAEYFISWVIDRYVPFGGYAASALTHEVPRVTLGFRGPDGEQLDDPDAPFDSVLGLLLPTSGEIRPD